MTTETLILAIIAGISLGVVAAGVYVFVLVSWFDRWDERQRREQEAEDEAVLAELEAEWYDEETGAWRKPEIAGRALA